MIYPQSLNKITLTLCSNANPLRGVYLCLHAVCNDVHPYASTKSLSQKLLMYKKGVDDGNGLLAGFVYGKEILS